MTNLHVTDDGPRDAPPLLLVHGSASSVRSWDALLPLLTEHHRVVRVDLLGHGSSAKPADAGYGVPEQAHRAGAELDRLGIGHAVVAGHSTGGLVATALAEERPGLVTGLVLVNTGPAMDTYIGPQTAFGPRQWAALTDEQVRDAMSSAFRPGYVAPATLVADVRGMTFEGFTAAQRGAVEFLMRQPVPERLTALGKPVLVLFGEDDRRWRPSTSLAAYRAVPGARVVPLAGVGHSPILEDPAATAGALLAFTGSPTLNRQSSASPRT
ncbi:Pimeloyl-ACP methyl ester carboxylesterase [Amycolatopsis pretoriensis]|uniref:Pimeloyl-ACP methyl ester carboxylesterase n=1 Tax=Amycolatopsis pretoriensis TaxID=218821 RepID=A0A1H5QCD2_9PSEU|nr:alpha/beta fold hydrolase [Amycolatopsis pretoriensis]SEF23659.1 Pimeloyl-ACP methyl ester carboxylesterase [Amycolatopsis pretoriensis]